jgi:hypothetical protein
MTISGEIDLIGGGKAQVVYLSPSEYQAILDQLKDANARIDYVLRNVIEIVNYSKELLAPKIAETIIFQLKGYKKALRWIELMNCLPKTDFPFSMAKHEAIDLLVKKGLLKKTKNGWYKVNE